MRYTSIDIIFNPNSTGPSKKYAEELHKQLSTQFSNIPIQLQKTDHAGHAEDIAYNASLATKRPLIVSSSGDGGYHEVINGILAAQQEGALPACAILAAGNANDHSRTLQEGSLFDAIKRDNEVTIDVLKITGTSNGKDVSRYAHSYIGFGLTPAVAVELNKTDLSKITEIMIVARTLFSLRPFYVKSNARQQRLDSLVFTNIGEMAKVLTMSKNATPDDGIFEIVMFPHRSRLALIRRLIIASVQGLDEDIQTDRYEFTISKRVPAQLDGEITYFDANKPIVVTAEHKLLRTVL